MAAKRLDSPEGLAALEKAIGRNDLERYGKAGILGAYLESWTHPWLAAYARTVGWTNLHAETLGLEDVTGHFDHLPYAQNSCCGEAVATPFETEQDGPVYFVRYAPWVTAVQIMGYVENILSGMVNGKHAWSPSWAVRVKRACEDVRHGLGSLEDAQMRPEAKAKAVRDGSESLLALAGDLGKAMLAWEKWMPWERERIATQLARLDALEGLFLSAMQAVA